jgi:hypothetical protein
VRAIPRNTSVLRKATGLLTPRTTTEGQPLKHNTRRSPSDRGGVVQIALPLGYYPLLAIGIASYEVQYLVIRAVLFDKGGSAGVLIIFAPFQPPRSHKDGRRPAPAESRDPAEVQYVRTECAGWPAPARRSPLIYLVGSALCTVPSRTSMMAAALGRANFSRLRPGQGWARSRQSVEPHFLW